MRFNLIIYVSRDGRAKAEIVSRKTYNRINRKPPQGAHAQGKTR